MITKKSTYITVYLLLLVPIFCIALLARIVVLRVMLLDTFSANTAFLITCILCMAIFLSFQSAIHALILLIMKIFFKRPKEILKTEDAKNEDIETKDVEAEEPQTEKKQIIIPYQEQLDAAQEKKRIETENALQKVLDYTLEELVNDMNEDNMQKLCNYIRDFQFSEAVKFSNITGSVKLSSDINNIDLFHFGWNIGNQFKKSGSEVAQFIKYVFADKLYDTEVTTIVRKLRMSGPCRIKIKSDL